MARTKQKGRRNDGNHRRAKGHYNEVNPAAVSARDLKKSEKMQNRKRIWHERSKDLKDTKKELSRSGGVGRIAFPNYNALREAFTLIRNRGYFFPFGNSSVHESLRATIRGLRRTFGGRDISVLSKCSHALCVLAKHIEDIKSVVPCLQPQKHTSRKKRTGRPQLIKTEEQLGLVLDELHFFADVQQQYRMFARKCIDESSCEQRESLLMELNSLRPSSVVSATSSIPTLRSENKNDEAFLGLASTSAAAGITGTEGANEGGHGDCPVSSDFHLANNTSNISHGTIEMKSVQESESDGAFVLEGSRGYESCYGYSEGALFFAAVTRMDRRRPRELHALHRASGDTLDNGHACNRIDSATEPDTTGPTVGMFAYDSAEQKQQAEEDKEWAYLYRNGDGCGEEGYHRSEEGEEGDSIRQGCAGGDAEDESGSEDGDEYEARAEGERGVYDEAELAGEEDRDQHHLDYHLDNDVNCDENAGNNDSGGGDFNEDVIVMEYDTAGDARLMLDESTEGADGDVSSSRSKKAKRIRNEAKERSVMVKQQLHRALEEVWQAEAAREETVLTELETCCADPAVLSIRERFNQLVVLLSIHTHDVSPSNAGNTPAVFTAATVKSRNLPAGRLCSGSDAPQGAVTAAPPTAVAAATTSATAADRADRAGSALARERSIETKRKAAVGGGTESGTLYTAIQQELDGSKMATSASLSGKEVLSGCVDLLLTDNSWYALSVAEIVAGYLNPLRALLDTLIFTSSSSSSASTTHTTTTTTTSTSSGSKSASTSISPAGEGMHRSISLAVTALWEPVHVHSVSRALSAYAASGVVDTDEDAELLGSEDGNGDDGDNDDEGGGTGLVLVDKRRAASGGALSPQASERTERPAKLQAGTLLSVNKAGSVNQLAIFGTAPFDQLLRDLVRDVLHLMNAKLQFEVLAVNSRSISRTNRKLGSAFSSRIWHLLTPEMREQMHKSMGMFKGLLNVRLEKEQQAASSSIASSHPINAPIVWDRRLGTEFVDAHKYASDAFYEWCTKFFVKVSSQNNPHPEKLLSLALPSSVPPPPLSLSLPLSPAASSRSPSRSRLGSVVDADSDTGATTTAAGASLAAAKGRLSEQELRRRGGKRGSKEMAVGADGANRDQEDKNRGRGLDRGKGGEGGRERASEEDSWRVTPSMAAVFARLHYRRWLQILPPGQSPF